MLGIFKTKPITNLPRPTQMEIICGDCAGEEVYPIKTNLMTDGTCAKCGGQSFVCAVRFFNRLALYSLKQKTEVNN